MLLVVYLKISLKSFHLAHLQLKFLMKNIHQRQDWNTVCEANPGIALLILVLLLTHYCLSEFRQDLCR